MSCGTNTGNLAEAMKADLRRLDPNVVLAARLGDPGIYVTGIDVAVSAVLKAHKGEFADDLETVLGARFSEIGGRTSDNVWGDAATTAGADLPSHLSGRVLLASEYAMVIA